MANAERAFPTDGIDGALLDVRERFGTELERRFDAPMRANRASLAALSAKAATLDQDHAILVRNHKGELDAAYAELAELKAKLTAARRAVDEAYGEMKDAKAQMSSWHSRSKSWIIKSEARGG